MNTLVNTARSASFEDGNIVIVFESAVEIRIPICKNPRLAKGTSKQLGNIEISPYGLHRPDLDEDLSFRGILSGNLGHNK